MPNPFVNFNFQADSAGTLLTAVASETGGPWSVHPSFSGSSIAVTAAHRVRGNAAQNNVDICAAAAPASADYDLEADLYAASLGGTSAGLYGRMSTSAFTDYLFYYDSGNSAWKLYSHVNGTGSVLGSLAQALTQGQTYHMRLSMRGTLITCWVNGVQIISVTDGSVTGVGTAGLFFSGTDSDSTGLHLANIVAHNPVIVAVTDQGLYWSPNAWSSNGSGTPLATNVLPGSTYALTPNPGNYCKLQLNAVANGIATLLLDTTPMNGVTNTNCPTVSVSIDGQAPVNTQLAYQTGTYRLALSSVLSAGAHAIEVDFKSVGSQSALAMGDRWNGAPPQSVVKVTGLELDGKGSATAAYVPLPNILLALGDSETEAIDCNGTGNTAAAQDAASSYARFLAAALNAEVGVIGWSGQGWAGSLNYGNVPALNTPTWDHYYNGQSRLISGHFAQVPTHVLIVEGKNDVTLGESDATVTAAVTAVVGAIAAAAPGAFVLVAIPPDGSKRSAIIAGLAAANLPRSALLDAGTSFQPTMAGGGWNTNDGIHPSQRGHGAYATILGKQAQAALSAASDTPGTTTLLGRLTAQRGTNLDNLDAAVSSRMATFTLPANFNALAITGGGAVTAGTVLDKTSYSLSASGLDLVLVESGITASANLVNDSGTQLTSINARQALANILAISSGQTSGAGGANFTIKAAGLPGITRVVAATDASGDRTSLTLRVPA